VRGTVGLFVQILRLHKRGGGDRCPDPWTGRSVRPSRTSAHAGVRGATAVEYRTRAPRWRRV